MPGPCWYFGIGQKMLTPPPLAPNSLQPLDACFAGVAKQSFSGFQTVS